MNHLDTHKWVPEFEEEHNGMTWVLFIIYAHIAAMYHVKGHVEVNFISYSISICRGVVGIRNICALTEDCLISWEEYVAKVNCIISGCNLCLT
jgi:hypothetical protein